MSNENKKTKQLKDEMYMLLSQSEMDSDRVLDIAHKLAQSVPGRTRFSVDASLINRLGRELVTRKEIAVAELIKNAYDADATDVTVTFLDSENAGGALVIEDNGNGMNRDQLISGFMRLASTEKIHEPYSPRFKRLRAGKKGIGRFATQRLGRKLVISTKPVSGGKGCELEIDWTRFETDKELFLISQEVTENIAKRDSGTTLRIINLEDAWLEADIKRVFRYVADLLQPFKLVGRARKSDNFEVKIYHESDEQKTEVASVEKLIYENAIAKREGNVNANGRGDISYSSEKYGIDVQKLEYGQKDDQEKNIKFFSLRNIKFVAYYYIQDELPKNNKTLVWNYLRENGGIRIYRNGFKVPPYGDNKNDWLALDQRAARRLVLVPFKNQNFLGFVEIVDVGGDIFEETSSREGLLESAAFKELQLFVGNALEEFAVAIGAERGRKGKPTKSLQTTPPIERIGAALEKLDKSIDIVVAESKNKKFPEDAKKTLSQIAEIAKQTTETTKTLFEEHRDVMRVTLEEVEMLRILASLGLAIGEFTHETKTLFPSLKTAADNIANSGSIDEMHNMAIEMKRNVDSLTDYLSYFDKNIAANAQRETKPQDINQVLYQFWKTIYSSAQVRGIVISEPTIHGYNLFTTAMHPSEWNSILFNLYTNSLKAIYRTRRGNGKILIKGGKESNSIYVEFADDGDGVKEKIRDRIFDAFVTTSRVPDPLEDPIQGLQGSGLGLKIVKDIVESRKGKIYLVGAPRGYNTCFRIEIPVATKDEKREYDY